jgi:signal transduction histidine kinase
MLGVAQAYHANMLLEAVDDALALFDEDDRLVSCNRAYLRLLAAPDESAVLGRTALELFATWLPRLVLEGDAARERLVRLQKLEVHRQRVSFDVQTKDGRHLRITDRRTAANGRIRTIWDLTDGAPADELERTPAATSGANTSELELLSWMNRKLFTPLNAMLGFAQLMQADRREPLSARQRGRLEKILQSGEHLARLLDDCIDFARLEAGKISVSLEAVNPVGILKEVIRALEHPALHTGTSIWLETPPAELPLVLVDPKRFCQVLMNFGSNAVKYNRPNGAVRFLVSLPAPDRLRVSVHDNGNGIPLQRQAELFRSPGQAHESAERREIGGTGLIIAKRLAELMGGTVGVKSTPGAGSEFWVEVRVA